MQFKKKKPLDALIIVLLCGDNQSAPTLRGWEKQMLFILNELNSNLEKYENRNRNTAMNHLKFIADNRSVL